MSHKSISKTDRKVVIACKHADYDEYFDRCPDCGVEDLMTQIEEEES